MKSNHLSQKSEKMLMSINKKNDEFISLLVEETLQGANSPMRSKAKQGLNQYFEKKNKVKKIAKGFLRSMRIFCHEHHVYYASGFYQHETKCFQMQFNEQTFHIPSNWAQFPEDFDHNGRGYLFAMEEGDESLLPSLFSQLLSTQIKLLYCFHEKDECLLVFLDEFHYRRFNDYFEDVFSSSVIQYKKAA